MIRIALASLLGVGFICAQPTLVERRSNLPLILGPPSAYSLVVARPDGALWVAGEFAALDGVSRQRLALLKPDGTLDTRFNPALGDAQVGAIYPLDDSVLVTLWSKGLWKLIRYHDNGAIDTNFSPPDNIDRVYGVAADSGIYVRWDFQPWRLRRDGSVDPTFVPSEAAISGALIDLAIQRDGKVLIGVPTTSGPKLLRLQSDGSIDPTFDAPTYPALIAFTATADLDVIALVSDGSWEQASEYSVIRLQNNGAVDTSFAGVRYPTWAVKIFKPRLHALPDGRAFIVGRSFAFRMINSDGSVLNEFTQSEPFSDATVHRDGLVLAGVTLRRLHNNGDSDPSLRAPEPRGPGYIRAIFPAADKSLLIAGDFERVGNSPVTNIARILENGAVDPGFAAPPEVYGVLGVQRDGRILVGASGQSIKRLSSAGTIDPSFNATLPPGILNKIIEEPDGNLLIGGLFSASKHSLIRLDTDGTLDASFRPEFDFGGASPPTATIYDIAIQPDGKILAGGHFGRLNGVDASWPLVRLLPDGAPDPTFRAQVPTGGGTQRIALQSDGRVIVAPSYYFAVGGVVRLTATGALDSQFHRLTFDGPVGALLVLPDDRLVVQGRFSVIDGRPCQGLAVLDREGRFYSAVHPFDRWFGPVVDNAELAVRGDELLVATTANGLTSLIFAPVLRNPVLNGSTFTATIGRETTWDLRIEESEDLQNWAPTPRGGPMPDIISAPVTADSRARFYRVAR